MESANSILIWDGIPQEQSRVDMSCIMDLEGKSEDLISFKFERL